MLLQVWKSSSISSVETLQSAVDDTVSQLEQQGLLTGEALGQIFTSVSDILNTEADQEQKDARTEVTQSCQREREWEGTSTSFPAGTFALYFSSGCKCWAKWPQFYRAHPATRRRGWRWQPELWQDSPSVRMSSVLLLRYNIATCGPFKMKK